MKKKIFILSSLIVLAAAFFLPFSKQVPVKINASYLNCYKQLITPQSWKNWLPEFAQVYVKDSPLFKLAKIPQGIKISIPGEYITISPQGNDELRIIRNTDSYHLDYNYAIVSGELGLNTIVMVTFKTNILKVLWPGAEDKLLAETGILSLKTFMESTRLFYGYNIHIALAGEKKIIVKIETIARSVTYEKMLSAQKELINYIKLNQLITAGPTMIQYNVKKGDSIQMMVGIPIKKQIKNNNKFVFMHIPSGRILIADFDGKYADKQKAYNALGNYVQDKIIHPKIAPMEIFESELPTKANSTVKFQLSYPIF